MVKIDDMLLGPEQLPDGLRQKFEDCERRGKNKGGGRNNFWPDYVWRKGGHKGGGN